MLDERKLLQKDNFSYFLFKKTERLTSALYLVTDLIPKGEPLRQTMRACSLNVMSFIAEEKGKDIDSYKREREDVLQNHIAELLALLNIGVLGRYISEMNREVLDREYKDLLRLFDENKEKNFFSQKQTLQSGFFNVTEEFLGSIQNKEKDDTALWGGELLGRIDKRHSKGHKLNMKRTNLKDKNTLSEGLYNNNKKKEKNASKDNRRNIILRFIKEKGRVSIKDISDIIFDCSEKTLQRELLTLVSEGVLKKEGERRWSTYIPVDATTA